MRPQAASAWGTRWRRNGHSSGPPVLRLYCCFTDLLLLYCCLSGGAGAGIPADQQRLIFGPWQQHLAPDGQSYWYLFTAALLMLYCTHRIAALALLLLCCCCTAQHLSARGPIVLVLFIHLTRKWHPRPPSFFFRWNSVTGESQWFAPTAEQIAK